MKQSSVLLNFLRRRIKRPVTAVLVLLFPLWTGQVHGATFYWDGDTDGANSTIGGTGTWDTTSNNWDPDAADNTNSNNAIWNNASLDIAFFSGTAGTISLGTAITAGGLNFDSDGYVITGDTLTLAAVAGLSSPIINVAVLKRATIDSIIAGSSGLTKTGNGTLALGNSANSFSGDVVINGGSLVITDQGQLGTGTTAISVNGLANTGNPGLSGGQLVLNGGIAGMTLSREITITGRGAGAANGSAGLVSVGNNTITGDFVLGSTGSEGRALATHGITTLTGGVQLGSGGAELFYGNGNWIISGIVTGFDPLGDRFVKTGNVFGTTLWLQNDANNFAQPLRIDSGTVRVATIGALGTNTGLQSLDLNGGVLELRTEQTDFSSKEVRKRGNGGGIFVDHSIGGASINQTLSFGNLQLDANASFTLSGRNGFGATFNGGAAAGGTAIDWVNGGTGAFVNSSNGLLTINADVLRRSEGTARTFTVSGSGDTLMTGSFLQLGTGAVSLVKDGVGTFTLLGTASTITGSTTINNGTLAISSFGGLAGGALLIGNATTTAGALDYVGAGETSNKAITINTTTANAYIHANGSGALVLTGAITALAGAKTLVLGGASTASNEIQSSLPANATNLQKIGAGTWVLSGANLYAGTTTVSGGILQIKDTFSGTSLNVVTDSSNLVFNVDSFSQGAGGVFEYLGDGTNASTESLGALIGTAGAGTVKVTAGAGGTADLTFSSLGTISAGSGINFITNAGGTVTLTGAADINGILNAHLYYNGADFASGSTVAAALYTIENTGASLAGGNTTPYLVNTTDITSQTTATINAGIKFDDNRSFTLADAQTLTIQNGGATVSGGLLVTGGSTVTISGGAGISTGGANDLVFRMDGVGDTLILDTPILAASTGGWTKLGAGTLVLGAANANTTGGQIHINEGTVQLSGIGRLGADSVDVRLRQGATLDLNGVSLGSATSGTASIDELNGAGIVTNSAVGSTAVLRVGNGNGNSFFNGFIEDGAGQISLVKSGTATFRLSGPQTYTGVVHLIGGNLDVTSLADIGVASGLGLGDATSDATNAASLVFNGGALRYIGQNTTNTYQTTQSPSVDTNRLFTLAGNGTIASFGSYGQNDSRSRSANHAALVFSNTAPVVFSGSGNRNLDLRGDSLGDNIMGLQLIDNPNTGLLNVRKFDSGLWILTNASNSYTGVTLIGGGALQAQDGSTLPTDSNLVIDGGGGIFQTSGTFTRALGTGANEVRFGATNLRGGFAASTAPLIVNLGTPNLVWGSSNSPTAGTTHFLGAGTLYLSSNTALADVTFVNDFEVTAGIDKAITVSTTNASTTVTLTGGTTTDGLTVGQAISGTNIPVGAFIASVNSTTQISISVNATATGTGISASVAGVGSREIRVDDNSNTGLDFATVSGVVSGAGGLGKVGAGVLILGDANTYSGNTLFREGGLFVSSIGAAGVTSSSLGTNDGGGILELGNPGTTTTVSLMYVGTGEVTTREINLVGSTGTRRIDSSGSGALVLTNLVNTSANSVNTTGGAKTLEIRGNNTDANMITSVLGNNGGTLTVNKFDGGLWILNPTAANTFTGVLTVGGGTLGLTADGIGSASQINMSNAAIFAHGGDLTTSVPMQLNNNTAAVFTGSYNITLNGNVTKQAGANDQTFSNTLENGAVLTINGNLVNAQTAAATRIINMRGYGSTVWNGIIQNNTTAGSLTRLDIRIANDASFTLGGDNKGAALGFTGNILLGQGTLIIAHTGGLGPTANNVILDGGVLTATVDLSGASKITNNIFLQGDPATVNGTQNIEFGGTLTNDNSDRNLVNDLSGGAILTLSGGVNLSQNSTSRTLTVRGTGDTLVNSVVANGSTATASALRMRGTGTVELTAANTYDGATSVENGVLKLSGAGALDQNSVITVSGLGVLRLDNSATDNGNRVSDTQDINLDHGTLDFIGNAGGSAESFGRLDINNNGLAKILISGGDSTLTFLSVNFANTGSSLDLRGVTGLGGGNKVIFTTPPSGAAVSNGILPRVMIGSDFAEYDATDGVRAFTDYNSSNNLGAALAADTMNLTAVSASVTGSQTVNAIRLDHATGVTVGATGAGATLTLASGGLIATGGGTHTLEVPILNTGANGAFFQVSAGTTLEVDSLLTGAAFTALQGGSINFNTRQFFTSTTNLHGGVLKLDAGLNTIMPIKQSLFVNPGATLDLNGNVQFVGNITTSSGQPGAGGSIISSAGTGTIVTDNGGNWMGVVSGDVNLGRVGGSTLTIGTAQTYTGWTFLTAGGTTLRDEGTLANTSGIDINLATLTLGNNDNLQTQNNNRINDAASITLRSGTLAVNGRVDTAASETLGAITAAMGANVIQSATGGTGTAGAFSSQDLTIESLTRSPGATVNFLNSTALGGIGNFPRIVFTTAPTTYLGGALGAWAIANSNDYAAYNSTNGVGTLGNGGYTGYDAAFGSGNITQIGQDSLAPLITTLSGVTTTALLRLGGVHENNIAFVSGGDVLNLELGGLLRQNNAFSSTIGSAGAPGVLTAGGTENSGVRELVIYSNTSGNPTFTGYTIGVGATVISGTNTQGLLPGMTVTNGNFPAGTTIVAVNNLNQVIVSQASTNSTSQSNQTLTAGSFITGTQDAGSNIVSMNSTVGVAPGMTITGTGIPANTYVVSVDSATQLTLSNNATTSVAGTASYTIGLGNIIMNSVIADNGFGNSVQLVKSGNGALNLFANNTYTGGTVINQGTVNLFGGGVIIPNGGISIVGAVLNTISSGQIASGNSVSIVGSSTLTLVGDNTLDSLSFNHIGGTAAPTVNTGGILTLTNATPITVVSNSAIGLPVVTGTLTFGLGAKTLDIGAIQLNGVVYDETVNRSLNLTGAINAPGDITKIGDGLLGLGGQNNFGSLTVAGGGIVLGTNSSSTVPNTLVSGPLGIGLVSMASGTRLSVDDSSRTVANAFSFAADPIFGNVGTTTDTLTLNGALTFATLGTSGLVANVETPYLNVVLGGPITGIGSVTAVGSGTGANTINKTGPGNISGINLTGISGTATIDLTGLTNLNTFSLLHDGDSTRSLETISLGAISWEPVNGQVMSLTIGKAGTGVNYPLPAWKTLAPSSLTSSLLPNGLTVTVGDGYGLLLVDDIALNTVAVDTGATFTVTSTNTSLLPPGLTLDGLITGGPAGASARTLIKSGTGTLVLGNALNTFGGGGSVIDITDGLIQVASDGALGDAANVIRISANNLAEGLRVTGTFATSREINLDGASSGIDVTSGNVFTLNSAFTFATATNALRKYDQGTLVLTQAQGGWDGVLTIGQGVLRISDGASLGTTTGNLIINNVGASLELDGSAGGVIVADDIRIASTNNSSSNGVNSSGAIHSTGTFTNTLTGAISIDTTTADSQSRSGTLAADLGSTLEVQGGIVLGLGTTGSNRDNWIGFGGEGVINLTMTGITHAGNLANGFGTLTKFGSGTLNIQVADALTVQRVVVKSGVLSINGAGTLGVPGAGGGTGDVYLNPTGVLTLDNSGTNVDNRLSGRNLNVSGADLNIIGNSAAATNETVGLFTLREGSSFFTLTADASQQLNFTSGTITRSAQATLIVRGSNLGDAAAAGVATIKGGNYVFIGQLGATGTTGKSILPWAFGDTNLAGGGVFFLTADSAVDGANTGANILRPLAANEQVTNLLTPLANVNLSTNEALSSPVVFNSLRLDNGGGVTLNYVPLTLDSGGLLALSGNTGITGFSGVSFLSTSSNRELIIHTPADLTLTIPIAGTTGALTKSGAGTLTLAAGNTNHSTVMVNDGTLKLGGGDQTILYGRNMWVNEGGTLDLNGTVQQVNILESRQSAVLARNDAHFGGGTVINSAGVQATLAMATASSIFAGQIVGNIAVVRSNAAGATADWNLYADQTYTGASLFNGGRVILNNAARLSATTSIEVANATLLITASSNATEANNLTDRINDAAAITLSGAMLQFRNIPAVTTTETFGDVILRGGHNIIDFAEGGSAVNQSDTFFASLAREAGSHTTVRFLNIDASPSDDQRLFIAMLNGMATTNIGDGLTNNLIGGWATFEREFASYTPGQGIGGLNTGGFAGYSPMVDPNLGGAADNIRIALPAAGALTVLTADRTLNSLNLQASTSATDDSTLNLGGFTLTLASGGLILSPVATTALQNSINVVNGSLTAGTTSSAADLYINGLQWFNGQADNTGNADIRIDASIVNNGAGGVVTLVIAGNNGRGSLAATNDVILTGNNTYTGGTFINSGQVRLNNTTADGLTNFAITGDLTIAGGYSSNAGIFSDRNTIVILDSDSQIANTATATIMGGAILNLNNKNQTLAALVFDNTGGTTPQVTTGSGTLTLTAGITASGRNLGSTSQIDGKLTFSAATATITVHPVEWLKPGDALPTNLNPYLPNLTINAPITGGNIIKAGGGILRLNGANGFTGDFDLQAGGILLGSNAALSAGVLTIGDNTTLSSTADNRVIANAYNVSGAFSLIDIFNLTMSGAGTLAAGNHDITVQFATKSLTLSGVLSGASAGINKLGDGILILGNNSNSYGGPTTVTDGTLVYGGVDVVPTGSALTVLEGALLDITAGGDTITVGSLAGNSATQGGVIVTTATSGTVTFTAGADNTSTVFGGVLVNAAGSTLNFVKAGSGVLILGGANQYNGVTTVADGRLVAKSVGGGSPLGTSQSIILGGGATSGILQLGDSAAPLDLTFISVATQGSGTLNKFVGGNAAASTLTLDVSTPSLLFANIGDAGANESNLNLVKNGAGDLSFAGTGTSTFNGTTTVNAGKLFFNTPGAFSTTTTSLTLADGTEFSLRGTTNTANQVFGFTGAGDRVVVGTSAGATLGFALDGGFNSQINLLTGQTLNVTGSLTTAVYVNSAPVSLQDYVLINGTDAGSLHAGTGTFDLNPVIFNGGSFTYALRFDSGINGGGADQWVLTPTAVPSAPDTWWVGDLDGLGTGVWSATTTSGIGFPSNWATAADGLTDALVPPDQNSIVHFSAVGAANFATTLGAHMTIQELIFHTGNAATTIGTSNGVNTLTLGNTVDASGITLETGAGDVGISVGVILAQSQSWNIEDAARVLALSGGLSGAFDLAVNDMVTNAGSLLFSGGAGNLVGMLSMHAGSLVFEDTGSLGGSGDVVLGTASSAATLQIGGSTAASGVVIGGLGNGSFAGSKVVGGNATLSTLTIGAASGSQTFTGALGGAGTNENNFNLVKDGAGTQILNGAVTYAGTTTVRQGVLQLGAASAFAPTGELSVIANSGATAIMDFNGKNFSTTGVLTLGGGTNGSAQIIGAGSTLTLGGNIVFDALNDPGAAVISTNISTGARTITVGESVNAAIDLTLNGTVAASGGITIAGAGSGAINGAWTLAGSNLANTFNSTGTWDFNAATNTTGSGDWNINTGVINATVSNALNAADDIILDGTGTPGSAIINISGTAGASGIHQGDDIFIRNGGLINVSVANGISTGTDQLVVGDSGSTTAGSAGVLNLNLTTSTGISVGTNGLLVGNGTQIGYITGTGIITTTGSKDLRNGAVGPGITLAGNGAILKQSTGTLIFSGDRAAASTGATHVREGNLILDYTTNNNSKIGGVLNLGLAGVLTNATLTLEGNASAATTQGVTSTTILNGNTFVAINNGAGQTATLNLNAITRAAPGGVVFFSYSSTDAKAASTSPAGTLGWATLVTGAGVRRFAAIDGSGDIVQATLTTENDVALWSPGQDIMNSGAFTGTVGCAQISSLTFAALAASTVNISPSGHLLITSGGIMVDSAVGALDMKILGGSLFGSTSGALGEIIVHQNNAVGTLTIGSNIVNSIGITKTGVGTLILSGNNSFRPNGSQLNINEGTIQLSDGTLLGSTMSILMRTGTTLNLGNSTQTVGQLATSSGTIVLGTGGLTINQTANATYSGVFTGGAASVFTVNAQGFNFNINATTTTGFTGSVVINSGLLQLSVSGRLANAAAFTINKGGNLLLDNNGGTISGARILDTASITLNSADGVFSGETRPRGLGLRTDQNTTTNTSETVGVITFASGANYSFMDNSGGTSSRVNIIASNYVRANSATFDVRGRNLGDTSTSAAWSQFRIAAGANQTAFISANLVGGAGTAGGTAKNVSIVPWAIGEYYTGANLGDTNMGNTLVTYVADSGFKPLNLTNEYNTFAAAAATDNVRESLSSDSTGLAGKTINSLVIHKNSTGAGAINVTGAGAGNALVNTSGTFLFTQNTGAAASSAHSVILGGFDDGIQVGASNEYIFFVVNPSSAATTATLTARVDSSLNTAAASVTKSGRGTLEFTAVNSYGGGTTVNEGSLLVHDNDNLGTGGLTLAGGTLSLAADFTDDLGSLATPTLTLLAGGGSIEVLGTSVTVTDLAISGTGALTKTGTGTLQLAGTTDSAYAGDFNVRRGTLELNHTAGDAIGGGNLRIGFSTTTNETATVRLLADNQIDDSTNVSVRSATTGAVGTLDLNDHAETIGSLTVGATTGSGVVVRTGASGILTVTGDITLNNDRNTNDTGTTPRGVLITGTGTASVAAPNTGTLDLGGATRTITVEAVVTTPQTVGRPDATIETVIQNGGVIKEGSRILYLSGDNTYTGGTTINNGGIELTGNLSTGAVTVSKTAGSLADAAVLSGAGNGTTTGIIGGAVTVGEVSGGVVCGVGILTPGLTTSPTVNTNGTLTLTAGGSALTVNDGSQIQLGITSATFTSSGLVAAFGDNTAVNALDYLQNAGASEVALWNANAGNRDFINLTGTASSLSIGTRASGTFGDGSVVVSGVSLATVTHGQVFNLIDWTDLVNIGGTFNTGGSSIYDATSSVQAGDLDLVALGAGFAWDVSAFAQYGVIVVVPEPSRALLLLFGFLGLMLRRRRGL